MEDFYNYYKTIKEIKILEDIYTTYNIKQQRGQYIYRQQNTRELYIIIYYQQIGSFIIQKKGTISIENR